MSLLMDALKKADEAKLTTSATENFSSPPVNWDEQLFPEFQEELAEIERYTPKSLDPVAVEEENTTTVDWDAQFLPDFAIESLVTDSESDDSSLKPVESKLQIPKFPSTNSGDNEYATSPVSAPANGLPKMIPTPSERINRSGSQSVEKEGVSAPQFMTMPTYTDELTLNFVKSEANTTESSPIIEKNTVTSSNPQDARAILAAHTYKKSSWTPWLILLLLVVLTSFGASYYYLEQMMTTAAPIQRHPLLLPPEVDKTPQTIVQVNPIQPNEKLGKTTPLPPSETVQKNVVKLEIPTVEEPKEKPSIPPIAEKTHEKSESSDKKIQKSAEPKKKPETPAITAKKTLSDKKTSPEKSPVDEYARVQNSHGIYTLQKSVTPPKLNQYITEAYTAFQRGDDVKAQKAYQKVLQQDSTNRDALLGLAAIAIRQDQPNKAEHYYKQLLVLYPQDSHAQLGLMNILGDKSPEYAESQLKQLIEKEPQSAYNHFNLGNYYAGKKQWEKAQQAYFEAYRNDSQQPNYVYNLAVSLDQLNQYHAASLYYNQAIQLSRDHPNHYFDIHAVQRRLQTLTQYNQTQTDSALNALSAKSIPTTMR